MHVDKGREDIGTKRGNAAARGQLGFFPVPLPEISPTPRSSEGGSHPLDKPRVRVDPPGVDPQVHRSFYYDSFHENRRSRSERRGQLARASSPIHPSNRA